MKTKHYILFVFLLVCFNIKAQTPNTEYFIDHDPGVGNATPIVGTISADSIISNLSISITGLTAGPHLLCVRVKDTNGKWSIYDKVQFFACSSIPVPDFSTTSVCVGSPALFTDLSTNTYPNTLYSWDFTNDGIYDLNISGNIYNTYTTAGTYTAKLKLTDTTGCNSEITHTVIVNPLPDSAGIITGPDTVCEGQTGVLYSVPAIANATSYTWTLPMGVTIAGGAGTNNITVNFNMGASSGVISAFGNNSCGYGVNSGLVVFIMQQPWFPTIGTITQPTCTLATGSVVLSSLPSGNWTLNPGNISGSGTTTTVTNLAQGTYNFTISDSIGCTSMASSSVVINAPPQVPPTPTITQNGNVLHSDAASGNQWYNQNGLIQNATGQNYTVTADGDYYVIVTTLGCPSDTSDVIHVVVSGIELTDENRSIKIYPNPVSEALIIEIPGNNKKINFEIYNAVGQVVFKGSLVNKTVVNTKTFASGLYHIKFENRNNFEFRKL